MAGRKKQASEPFSLARFRLQLEQTSSAAAEFVGGMLDSFRDEFPDGDVGAFRDAAIEAIEDSLNVFGEQAGALACDLFEQLAAARGLDMPARLESDPIDRSQIDKRVRYFAKNLVMGDSDAFARDVRDLTRDYVMRSANENIMANCRRRKVRWARVPSGFETCAFCLMLSSRGFVYLDEKSAKSKSNGGAFHRHCDCIAVPGFGNLPQDEQIDGYRPSEMLSRLSMVADGAGIDLRDCLTDGAAAKALESACDDAGWAWLYSGKEDDKPPLDVRGMLGAGSSGIIRMSGARSFEDHEYRAFFAIANAGRDFTVNGVKPEDRWNGKSSPDITMGGERWEVKCPSGNNKKKTILRNINKAVFQMKNANPPAEKVNIVISSLETELSMDEINYQVDKRIGRGEIDAILVIEKDGKLAMHTKK